MDNEIWNMAQESAQTLRCVRFDHDVDDRVHIFLKIGLESFELIIDRLPALKLEIKVRNQIPLGFAGLTLARQPLRNRALRDAQSFGELFLGLAGEHQQLFDDRYDFHMRHVPEGRQLPYSLLIFALTVNEKKN